MTSTAKNTTDPSADVDQLFDRLFCAVDLSPAGLDATRQAARFVSREGSLLLVTVAVGEPVAIASPAGLGATVARTAVDETIRQQYRTALGAAANEAHHNFPAARTRLVEGDPLTCLLAAIRDERATLAAVGSHDYQRLPGILLGSVATHLLHKAPCSVLIARKPSRLDQYPRRVLVGIDGSPGSALALLAALSLTSRLGGEVDPLVAYGGKPVEDLDAVRRLADAIETFDEPVHALVARASADDLIVVGSRGLYGLRSLGSVSERVAHRAPCSVLVVRPPEEER